MKIISTTGLSTHGNDNYNYKSVTLIEEFGMYNILTVEKVIGPCGDKEEMYLTGNTTCNFDKAKYMYKQAGGILSE